MSDFNIEVKFRNGRLLKAIRDCGYDSISEFCRHAGVAEGAVGRYLNLKDTPLKRNGYDFKETVIKVAIFLNKMPNDLFPAEALDFKLETNKADKYISSEEMLSLTASANKNIISKSDPERMLEICERNNALSDIVGELNEREQLVLNDRFGINGETLTLREVGRKLGVCSQRVREIEMKALKKLRNIKRRKPNLNSFNDAM